MPSRSKPKAALGHGNGNTSQGTVQNLNQRSKRPVECIDLTATDDESETRPQKIFRPTNDSGYQSRTSTQISAPSQTPTSQTLDFEDEEDADELIVWSQEDGVHESFERYGTLQTKIVGVQYYRGEATVGEHVIIKREPHNQYDANAIRVDNVQRLQIGHIPRVVAAKLASYMDRGSLYIDAIIPGPKGTYDCPLTVGLYGTSDPAGREQLKREMETDRLPTQVLKEREREEKKKRAEELRKVAKKGKGGSRNQGNQKQWEVGPNPQYEGTSSQGIDPPASTQSLDDIIIESQRFNPREMGEVVEKFGAGEEALSKMPMVDKPNRISTEMLPYQKQGLAWLLEKENPKLPAAGSSDVVQLWKRKPGNSKLFTNIATNFSIKDQEPVLASGGILADDMGLGKTLQMIALIIADMEMHKGKIAKQSRATLIVAPLSVMSNWSGQMVHHVDADSPLRVLTYHGANKKSMSSMDFAEFDVVITTYGTLASEYLPASKGKKGQPAPIPRKNGLYSVNWRRVILDEGHNIRNPSTKGALAATNILARSRWALTGTPIINNLKDLYSLVRFVGLTGGLERLELFNSVLIRPVKDGQSDATLLLQALMSTLCLRRRKEMAFVDLKLPELNEYVHRIKFLDDERKRYDALQQEAKGMLQTFKAKQSRGDKKAQETYRHLLEVLLRLRQVCNHWQLCRERVTSLMSLLESQQVVDLTTENRKALQDMLQLSIESREDCPVCLEDLTGHSPVITHCGHIFGTDCITRVIETQHKCPMCRAPLEDENCLVQPAVGLGEEDGDQAGSQGPVDTENSSSKVAALLSILAAAHKKAGTKFVIFSQWARFLDLLQPHLDEAGYTYARIDGSMPAAARDASLQALDSDPDTTILLASLGVCAVGLNLVAANMVVLCDSWWAPAIEDQAVDRVHRLGQKRECTVWRLVMEDSVEERTLEIQAEKRKLMMAAFQERENKRMKGRQTRLGDIQKLLG